MTDSLLLDRYPGARPFDDTPEEQGLFFGRSQEIDNLVHRIGGTRLLVLFGKSGLGKTWSRLSGGYPPNPNEPVEKPVFRPSGALGTGAYCAVLARYCERPNRSRTRKRRQRRLPTRVPP